MFTPSLPVGLAASTALDTASILFFSLREQRMGTRLFLQSPKDPEGSVHGPTPTQEQRARWLLRAVVWSPPLVTQVPRRTTEVLMINVH